MSRDSEIDSVKAKIPHREPFLFVDRIVEQTEGGIVTEREVRADEPHFAGHYPGAPLMPGVLICEACFQTGAILLGGADLRSANVMRTSGPQDADQRSASLWVHRRGRLPHWEQDCGAYFVTWRLADALPQSALDQILAERRNIVDTAQALNRELTPQEHERLERLHTDKIEGWLNAGHGSCSLRDPRCAKIVADALKHFDGDRYDLHAWCVMPNHVHVVFRTRPGTKLHRVLQSWKTFTARECNKLLDRTGTFWMDESFDRLVRDEDELQRYVAYTLENPAAAGLTDWPWVGCAPSGVNLQPAESMRTGGPHSADQRSAPRLRKPVLTRILEAKFRGMVRPGDLMRVEVTEEEKMGEAYVMNGRVDVAGKNVLRVKFIVAMVEVESD